MHRLCILYNLAKGGDQSLSQPEAEHELGSSHQQLRRQSLEEAGDTLILEHVGHDASPGFRVVEMTVLDTGLDHVQGSGDNERCASSANRCDEVLGPRGRVVVLQVVDVFLGESRTTEELMVVSYFFCNRQQSGGKGTHTANDPGALRAAVQPAPRYNPMPSSEMILKRPRPRKASGLV